MFRAPWKPWAPIEGLSAHWELWLDPAFELARKNWLFFRETAPKEILAIGIASLNRRQGVETGQVEGLYRLPLNLTESIAEYGVASINLAHITASAEVTQEKALGLIKDQTDAAQFIVSQIRSGEALTCHDIRSLHSLLTANQDFATGRDPSGKRVSIPLLKGAFKVWPNNPTRPDGLKHEYCPPEHIQSEIDRLLQLHEQYKKEKFDPVIEAAWFHHRYVQIHPFQDGNGRTGRALVNLILMEANLPPLVIHLQDREAYIAALEKADAGDLGHLVWFFQSKLITEMGNLSRMDTDIGQTEVTLEIKEKFDVDRANTEAILGWLTESELAEALIDTSKNHYQGDKPNDGDPTQEMNAASTPNKKLRLKT